MFMMIDRRRRIVGQDWANLNTLSWNETMFLSFNIPCKAKQEQIAVSLRNFNPIL